MINYNIKDIKYVHLIKERIDKHNDLLEKENLIKEAIKELKTRGFTEEQIKELFSIGSYYEQTNNTMIDNNVKYLALLKKVLKERR